MWSHWDDIEADLAERFGIDMWADGWDMPWAGLQVRITSLITAPMGHYVAPVEDGYEVRTIPATRLQAILMEE